MQKENFSRSEFHKLIWSRPLTQLAKEWGVPYKALKELCEEMNIPKPDSAYWSKINFGKNPTITPLHETENLSVTIDINQLRESLKPKIKASTVETVKKPKPNIVVSKKITHFDPIVQATKDRYTDKTINRWASNRPLSIEVDVSKDNFNRALRIADAFIKSLRKLGYDFTRQKDDLCIVKRGVELPVKVFEKFQRENRIVDGRKQIVDTRSGKLSIKFKIRWDWKAQAETDKVSLEEKLPHILEYVEKKIDEGYEYQQQLERGWARQREEKRKRDEEKLKRENELAKLHDLFSSSERFYKAQHIRNYVSQIEERATLTSSLTKELREWIHWARDKADWIDPFVNKDDELLNDADKNKIKQFTI